MGEAAMVSKAIHRPFESPKYVEIGRFRGQRHGCGGERGFAVESGSAEAGSGQKMGEGFQEDFVTQRRSMRAKLPHAFLAHRRKSSSWLAAPPGSFRPGHSRFRVGWFWGTRRVRASGTTDIVMGRRPSNSPSAST